VRIRHGAPLHFEIEARIYWLCSLACAAIWDSELEKLNAVVAIGGWCTIAARGRHLEKEKGGLAPVNGYGRHGFFVIKNGSTLR
jgi:hypothetical protein